MMEKFKRKANSPCENPKSKPKTDKNLTKETLKLGQFESRMSDVSMNTSLEIVDSITLRVVKKDEEKFEGALTRSQCSVIWKNYLRLADDLLYGVSLVQVPDRPFMVDFQLNESVSIEEIERSKTVKIGESSYEVELFVPRDPPPKLGENFMITFKNTRFKISLDQIDTWMGLFGKIIEKARHVDADDWKGVKTDEAVVVVRLKKYVPSFLPAFGRKLMARYRGQPLQCSKCFQPGHLRKKCESSKVEWIRYVKALLDENLVDRNLMGSWAEAVDALNAKEEDCDN